MDLLALHDGTVINYFNTHFGSVDRVMVLKGSGAALVKVKFVDVKGANLAASETSWMYYKGPIPKLVETV